MIRGYRKIIDQSDETDEIKARNGQLLALLYEAIEYIDELEAELKTLREQREGERDTQAALEEQITQFETERDDLRRQLQATNRRVNEFLVLIEFVEEQREFTQYQERRQRLLDNANILRR